MRLPRGRRLWAVFAALGACGVALVGGLAVAGMLAWVEALQLAALGILGLGAAGLGVLLRRCAIQMHRLRRAIEDCARGVPEALGADRTEVLDRVEATRAALAELRRRELPGLAADIARQVEDGQGRRFAKLTEHVSRQGRNDYEQQVAWQELREFLRPGPFMPALRGWAASPDVLRVVVGAVRRHPPELVVECGSGASSVWLGYALRRAGTGRLVALEHDERYAELSGRLVLEHGLDDIVEIRHAPLRNWTPSAADAPDPSGQPWYTLDAVADLEGIDLLFVDGPPHFTATEARYPAGPVLLPRCSAGAVVVLDDTIRAEERAVSDRWLAAIPGLVREEVAAEKGAHVFSWRRR
ncbi:class I SAM-dependent methyltransferase [Allosalinactinospora lopnorensis]|uniref:class I SAM-dependent methyltransferase n=1 Tax=Allosalinactinospora lopnorensis TaxID=1352348 RepID=UPI000623E936|nr:class I SAM-dependent methyltransferase [Allosalinactinospora lopnorensis]